MSSVLSSLHRRRYLVTSNILWFCYTISRLILAIINSAIKNWNTNFCSSGVTRWISGAAVVNAFYSASRNQIGKVYQFIDAHIIYFLYIYVWTFKIRKWNYLDITGLGIKIANVSLPKTIHRNKKPSPFLLKIRATWRPQGFSPCEPSQLFLH